MFTKKGDFLFIDPPYLGTLGNYNHNSLLLNEFTEWESNLIAPRIITYSEPIPEIEGEWKCWLRKKVPNVRLGGSKVREDWYVYKV